jgi:pyruvate,water dikinase
MVQSFTDEFKVAWGDPSDENQTWLWDRMHFPRPMPPLTLETLAVLERDVFCGARSMAVNGYHYTLNSVPPPPTPEIMKQGLGIWDSAYVPIIRTNCEQLRSADYDSMTAAELADALEAIISGTVDSFRYTMVMVFAFMGPTFQLLDYASKEIGPDADQLVATLLQGFDNGSAAAGAGLGDLADFARGYPALVTALASGQSEGIADIEGGKEFLERLGAYLAEYGWRAESWGLPHVPTWAEDPGIPMALIGRYAADSSNNPATAIERSRQQQRDAMAEIESRLDGERLAEFKKRVAACEAHVPISEGRARWQLTIIGSMRVPVLALGQKLVDAGALEEPNDAFYLEVEELRAAARDPGPSTRKIVARRKADLERWEKLSPPPFLGAEPPPAPPELSAIRSKFFGVDVVPSRDAKTVKGNPASRGTARGRARVIRDLSEANRLEEGDILVCPSTAPPWTPLFAIAAAVVTDTGGILSHSAICAREFGLPCIVGTQEGTRKIPDGAMITVDATEGVVHID